MDPTTQTALMSLFNFLPPPANIYAADALGIAGVLSIVASLIAAKVRPPADTAPSWLRTVYRVVTWPALNLGWARNAVVPGMTASVQTAAKEAAAFAAAHPEVQVVAPLGVVVAAPKVIS